MCVHLDRWPKLELEEGTKSFVMLNNRFHLKPQYKTNRLSKSHNLSSGTALAQFQSTEYYNGQTAQNLKAATP